MLCVTSLIGRWLASPVFQRREYDADAAGADRVNAAAMIGLLETLQARADGDPRTTWQRLTATHPEVAERIEALEELGGESRAQA